MKDRKIRNVIFGSAALFLAAFLVVGIFLGLDATKDCAFLLVMLLLFYFIEKKYPLPIPIIFCGLFPMILDPIGITFGFFNFYPFGIGYDKFIHFGFNLLGTLVIFYLLKNMMRTQVAAAIIVAILAVNGIGNIGKLLEFVGSRYVGYYPAGHLL